MLRTALLCLCFIALAACSSQKTVAEFWRPVSEPNLQMPLDRAQSKLEFDMSRCRCGIFPQNMLQADIVAFQPDQQRLAQTSVNSAKDEEGTCIQRPSLVVAECMRTRGWEITKCSGRMPAGQGAAVCALTLYEE